MRYRIKEYTIGGDTDFSIAGKFGVEDIRLIINETQRKVICSSMNKSNIVCDYIEDMDATFISFSSSICILHPSDKLTIEVDKGDTLTQVASKVEEVKQAVNNIDLSPIETKVEEGVATLSTKIDNIDLSAVENKVQEESAAIQSKIDNIKLPEIDLSAVAKQGENQEATMSKVMEELNIVNTTLNELITKNKNLNGFTFIDDGVEYSMYDVILKPLKVIDINIDYNGYEITDGFPFNNAKKVEIRGLRRIATPSSSPFLGTGGNTQFNTKEGIFPDLEEIGGQYFLVNNKSIEVLYTPKVKKIVASNTIQSCTLIRELIFPELVSCTGNQCFKGLVELRKLYIPKVESLPSNFMDSTMVNLIDFTIGGGFKGSFNISRWSPTNALSSVSTSLIEDGEIFANNLEKLLYNIREHIAANLIDRTGLSSFTITVSSSIKSAILADQETADAFTNKGWTIA